MDPLADMRREYAAVGLDAASAGTDPMERFREWFEAARAGELEAAREPNAMAVATVAADGTPSNRMVLLKAVDVQRAGFTWYTGLDSRKGRECADGGRAAIVFWWPGSARQVRVQGVVEEVDARAADDYFATRPAHSRIGAAASPQSRAIASRETLEMRVRDLTGATVARPARWGGLTLVADELEFWQGRTGRLHDRITFLRLDADGAVRAGAAVDAAGGDAALRAVATEVEDAQGVRWLRARLAP